MTHGTGQDEVSGHPERDRGEMMLAGWSITYGDAGTDEHMLDITCHPVGFGEVVEESGEPIVRDTSEPVGDAPRQDCDYEFLLNGTLFRFDEKHGWVIEEMSDDP